MKKSWFPTHGIDYLKDEKIPVEISHFILEHDVHDADILYPHRHSFYLILIITKGTGTHMLDFSLSQIEPNTLYFITPHQVHHWDAAETIEGYTIAFQTDFFSCSSISEPSVNVANLFRELARVSKIKMDESEPWMVNLLEEMLVEYEEKYPEYLSIVRAYLHIFLLRVKRIVESMEPTPSFLKIPELVRRFLDMVSENVAQGWSVQQYADELNTSASNLHSVLKTATGKTPAQVIHEEIILEAKRLLINSSLTVAEVGYKLQFSDPSYFTRFFRRETGLSPSIFRKDIREKYHH